MFEDYRVGESMEKGLIAASNSLDAAKENLILASVPRLTHGWMSKEGAQ